MVTLAKHDRQTVQCELEYSSLREAFNAEAFVIESIVNIQNKHLQHAKNGCSYDFVVPSCNLEFANLQKRRYFFAFSGEQEAGVERETRATGESACLA